MIRGSAAPPLVPTESCIYGDLRAVFINAC